MLTILNDIHVGVQRTAGTTPYTQLALRKHILAELARLMPTEGDLLINGDLFDTGNVPIADMFEVFSILSGWITRTGGTLYNSAGNHDLSKNDSILSSFQFLGKLLARVHPDKYRHIEEPVITPYGYVIPHLANQALFDLALTQMPSCDFLFLHCNFDNNFAVESDQSLNLSREQAEAAPAGQIIIAHEHQPRSSGKVIIPGNQIATSVADWQQQAPNKGYLRINRNVLEVVHSQQREADYVEMPWNDMSITEHKFVRVTGKVASADATTAITAINKLRTKHPAFVITNGMTIVSEDTGAIVESSLEAVSQFSVLDALKEIFTAEEFAVIEEVNAKD